MHKLLRRVIRWLNTPRAAVAVVDPTLADFFEAAQHELLWRSHL